MSAVQLSSDTVHFVYINVSGHFRHYRGTIISRSRETCWLLDSASGHAGLKARPHGGYVNADADFAFTRVDVHRRRTVQQSLHGFVTSNLRFALR